MYNVPLLLFQALSALTRSGIRRLWRLGFTHAPMVEHLSTFQEWPERLPFEGDTSQPISKGVTRLLFGMRANFTRWGRCRERALPYEKQEKGARNITVSIRSVDTGINALHLTYFLTPSSDFQVSGSNSKPIKSCSKTAPSAAAEGGQKSHLKQGCTVWELGGGAPGPPRHPSPPQDP